MEYNNDRRTSKQPNVDSKTQSKLIRDLNNRPPLFTVYNNFISRYSDVTPDALINLFKIIIAKYDSDEDTFGYEDDEEFVKKYIILFNIDYVNQYGFDDTMQTLVNNFKKLDIALPYYEDLVETTYSNGFSSETVEANNNLVDYFDNLFFVYTEENNRYIANNSYRINSKYTYHDYKINQESLSRAGTPTLGGFFKKKKATNKPYKKKIIQGKERCIYKINGSRKDYIKHKGTLIAVTEFIHP